MVETERKRAGMRWGGAGRLCNIKRSVDIMEEIKSHQQGSLAFYLGSAISGYLRKGGLRGVI